jgi:hypothetical protein
VQGLGRCGEGDEQVIRPPVQRHRVGDEPPPRGGLPGGAGGTGDRHAEALQPPADRRADPAHEHRTIADPERADDLELRASGDHRLGRARIAPRRDTADLRPDLGQQSGLISAGAMVGAVGARLLATGRGWPCSTLTRARRRHW